MGIPHRQIGCARRVRQCIRHGIHARVSRRGQLPALIKPSSWTHAYIPLPIGPSAPYTGTGDAFALKLDSAFSTAGFLTYLGGSCNDSGSHIALDPSGNIWISGTTTSPDFPLKSPFQGSGIPSSPIPGFVSELSGDGSQLLFSSFSEGSAHGSGPGRCMWRGWSGSSASVGEDRSGEGACRQHRFHTSRGRVPAVDR